MFATAEERLDQYAWHYHSAEQYVSLLVSRYQAALTLLSEILGDIHDIIEDAAQKDSQIMKTYNRLSSLAGFNVSGHYISL